MSQADFSESSYSISLHTWAPSFIVIGSGMRTHLRHAHRDAKPLSPVGSIPPTTTESKVSTDSKSDGKILLKARLPHQPLKTETWHVFDCSIHAIDLATIQLTLQSVNVFQTPHTERRQVLS